MRQCIFCMQWKEEKEFNREHIILEALGGKGEKYLKDYIAVDIRNFLTKYDYKKMLNIILQL